MNSQDLARYSIATLCFSASAFLGGAYYQIKQSSEAAREVLYTYRNAGIELERAANQIKLAGFQLRPDAAAFLESLNTAQAERARLATMRSGESVARMAEEGARAIADLRRDWTHKLAPRVGVAIENYANLPVQVQSEMQRLTDTAVPVLVQGRTTLELVNQFLASPALAALVPKIERILTDADTTLQEVQGLAAEIKQAAGKSQATVEELTALLGELRGTVRAGTKAVNAGERVLDEGTKTLQAVRRATIIGALSSIAGLLFR